MAHDVEKHLEFITPGVYPGEHLSEDEAVAAAFDFELLTAELFARYADVVAKSTGDDMETVSMILVVNGRDGSSLKIEVFNILQPEYMIREIAIALVDHEGRFAATYTYTLNQDGTRVVRRDTPDMTVVSEVVDLARHEEGAQAASDALSNLVDNILFETEMGVNEQPVGIEDISALRTLLSQSTPQQVL